MPGAHRDTDDRICRAVTNAALQSTVKINGLLAAVEGDVNSHGAGQLQAAIKKTIRIEGILVICAPGDHAAADNYPHPAGPTWPKGHSPDTFYYGGTGGGS